MNDTSDDDNGNVERLRQSRWLSAKYLLLRVHCANEKADSQAVTTTLRYFVEKILRRLTKVLRGPTAGTQADGAQGGFWVTDA